MTISAKDPSIHKPRFCEGSIMRHVIVMAGTGTIGLMAVFLVDFLNLFYISRLGDTRYTAAIGFANVINFLQVAICIGMSIGITVVTARLIGAKKHDIIDDGNYDCNWYCDHGFPISNFIFVRGTGFSA